MTTPPTDTLATLSATALIAEDEPLLARALQADLAAVWPQLRIVAHALDGEQAVEDALALLPDLLFLDIRMPGRSGLAAAEAIVEDWPDGRPLPLIVFVTAYDAHALQAFELSAVDYLLKPASRERLGRACERLRERLAARASASRAGVASAVPTPSGTGAGLTASAPDSREDALLDRLRVLLAGTDPALARQIPDPLRSAGLSATAATTVPTPLRVIQAAVGQAIVLVPVEEVIVFEAADKYVRVLTAERELLIRTALRELLPQLDPERFWQVHRGTVVQAAEIARAERDEAGRLTLHLRRRPETLAVSRLHAGRFKAM